MAFKKFETIKDIYDVYVEQMAGTPTLEHFTQQVELAVQDKRPGAFLIDKLGPFIDMDRKDSMNKYGIMMTAYRRMAGVKSARSIGGSVTRSRPAPIPSHLQEANQIVSQLQKLLQREAQLEAELVDVRKQIEVYRPIQRAMGGLGDVLQQFKDNIRKGNVE